MPLPDSLPRWAFDLVRYLPLKSQFLLSGNVRDRYPWPIHDNRCVMLPLGSLLAEILTAAGVSEVLRFDPLNGFSIPSLLGRNTNDQRQFFQQNFELNWDQQQKSPATVPRFFELLPRFVHFSDAPVAVLADFSSRYLIRPDLQTADEHRWFTDALILSLDASARPFGPQNTAMFNSIIWIADRESDLPDWLVLNNPRLRSIVIPLPDRAQRDVVARTLVQSLPGARQASVEYLDDAANKLVEQTHGLMLVDMVAITDLCRNENVDYQNLEEGVRRFKLGVTENPWAKLDKQRIANGDRFIAKRIKGQEHAVVKVLDIVKRAVIGLSGPDGRCGRPRGVAFLAGPTGTGKTELAKAITELLFGDESAYIRFDMSEFSAEHSDQRLIGAPPGYVGYDAGGELTNAIREKPFSVVLFDEIEKAHPRILDKFLQVLDDGVLSSGRGERVYFSEAFIVFTSNLGLYKLDSHGNRIPNTTIADDLPIMQNKIREEIERFFKLQIGRPEILNRIGENIIIFDFIRSDVAVEIFDMMLDSILDRVGRTTGFELTIADQARTTLAQLCLTDLSNGGRGIRNQLESHLVNPLARAIFAMVISKPVEITTIRSANGLTTLELQ